MADELTFAGRCYLVGRMLQVQPTASLLEAFGQAWPRLAERAGLAVPLPPDALEAVNRDHLHLFVGLGTPLAPPWESVWASDARLLFQRETLDVRYWYRSAGLQAARLHHEPDDHIGLELEFVGALAERGELRQAASFAREHPLAWAQRWAQAVHEGATHPFYPALADAALELLEQAGSLEDAGQ